MNSFTILSLIISFLYTIAETSIPATSNLVLWQGRTVSNTTEQSVSFDWEGIQAMFVVTGSTTVNAIIRSTFLNAPPNEPIVDTTIGNTESFISQHTTSFARQLQSSTYPKFGIYHVFVNNVKSNTFEVFPSGPTSYPLITGLNPANTYNITLYYMTDPVYNTWPNLDCIGCYQSIMSFTTDGTISQGISRSRNILIIGDSITAGNGLISPCPSSPNATCADLSVSYGALLCNEIDANCTTLAVSSKGIYENCCDNYNITMKDFALRTLAQDPTSVYDWTNTPPPSLILCNIGTNDSGKDNGPQWVTNFINTYVEFIYNLVVLTGNNRQLPIFLGVGPITNRYLLWLYMR